MNRSVFTSSRKLDHLRICLEEKIESGRTGFDDIRLVHQAIPSSDMDTLDLSTDFLGHHVGSPLFISAMTGGHPETKEVNRILAQAAQKYQLGIGVGSQRAAIENPSLADTFSIVRETAPDAFVVGNLGIVQLKEHGIAWAETAVEMIEADALAIHLNFLQEAIQPEGDHNATGCLDALSEVCSGLSVPVIVKETGCGISEETARLCFHAGVSCVDVGGYGGSSWAAIESFRAMNGEAGGDRRLSDLGLLFREWGIPTAVSVSEVVRSGGPVIASGGIRTGIDIAKALALGAQLGGMALPLLKPACNGINALSEKIEMVEQELRIALFLTGHTRVSELANTRWYGTGPVSHLIQRK